MCTKGGRFWFIMINILFSKPCRKLYYEHFTPDFWLHNNLCEFTALKKQIQKNILYSKTGFKHLYKNKNDSDLVWQIQLISIKG